MSVLASWKAFAVQREIEPHSIHIAPLTREHAEDISTWRYEAPYDVYDMVGTDPEEFLHPGAGYHASWRVKT